MSFPPQGHLIVILVDPAGVVPWEQTWVDDGKRTSPETTFAVLEVA